MRLSLVDALIRALLVVRTSDHKPLDFLFYPFIVPPRVERVWGRGMSRRADHRQRCDFLLAFDIVLPPKVDNENGPSLPDLLAKINRNGYQQWDVNSRDETVSNHSQAQSKPRNFASIFRCRLHVIISRVRIHFLSKFPSAVLFVHVPLAVSIRWTSLVRSSFAVFWRYMPLNFKPKLDRSLKSQDKLKQPVPFPIYRLTIAFHLFGSCGGFVALWSPDIVRIMHLVSRDLTD